jgi:hypothetical protein
LSSDALLTRDALHGQILSVIGVVLHPTAPKRIDQAARPRDYGAAMNKQGINFKIGDEEAKRLLIADIAYFAAERRGFSPGFELDDWLQAEQEVEASMEAPAPSALDTGR